MEADRRYSKYFKTNDKAETYKKIKVYCKKYILTGNKSERDLVMALHIILSTGSVLNDINLTKAFQQKAKRLTPLS